jgi:hypothetical protein
VEDVDKFIIDSSKTLTIDANMLEARSVTNNGTLNITKLETNSDIDLSVINENVAVDWSGNGTFDGKFGNADVTVSSGEMNVDVSLVNGKSISGAGSVLVDNLQSNTGADLSNITTDGLKARWSSGDGEWTGNFGSSMDSLEIVSGTMSVDDSKLDILNVSGNGNLTVNVDDGNSDLSNVIINGTLNINSGGDDTIIGSENSDIIDISTGNDDIKAGGGSDIIKVKTTSLTSSDKIDGEGGDDELQVSGGGTTSESDLSNVTNVEKLTFDGSDNTLELGSNDKFSSIDLGDGKDNVVLDFSNTSTINTGSGSDTAKLTGTATVANDGDDFSGAYNINGIEVLDLRELNSGGGFSDDNSKEFEITKAFIERLTGSSTGDLTIELKAEQAEDIMFTDKDSNEYNTTDTAQTYHISDNSVYHLDADTDITIDIV